jgi:hypothetical protein
MPGRLPGGRPGVRRRSVARHGHLIPTELPRLPDTHGLGHGVIGAAVAAWPAVALVGRMSF